MPQRMGKLLHVTPEARQVTSEIVGILESVVRLTRQGLHAIPIFPPTFVTRCWNLLAAGRSVASGRQMPGACR